MVRGGGGSLLRKLASSTIDNQLDILAAGSAVPLVQLLVSAAAGVKASCAATLTHLAISESAQNQVSLPPRAVEGRSPLALGIDSSQRLLNLQIAAQGALGKLLRLCTLSTEVVKKSLADRVQANAGFALGRLISNNTPLSNQLVLQAFRSL